MARLPYMKLFVNAFLADTGELSEAEFGAYCRLLMKMWKRGGRLPNDAEELRKLAGCPKASIWAQRWHALARFFEPDEDGFLVNPKLSEERDHALGISGNRSKAGVASAAKRAQQNPNQGTADPNLGNSSGPKPLENNEVDSTSVERRARVQTAQQRAESEESDTVVPFPQAQQAAPVDDWPAGGPMVLLRALADAVAAPHFDFVKHTTTKLMQSAAVHFPRWQDAGCSWAKDVVPQALLQCADLTSPVRSLALFDGAILDNHRRRTAPYDPATGGTHDQRPSGKFASKNANVARSFIAARSLAPGELDA